jgi:hypothetical protein
MISNSKDLGKALKNENFLMNPENLNDVKSKDRPQLLYKYLI